MKPCVNCLLADLVMLATLMLNGCGSDNNNDLQYALQAQQKSTFDTVTLANIQAKTLSDAHILCNADNTNPIPTGTIVVYKTNAGRYGKFQVAGYTDIPLYINYNMIIKWVTYNADGTIYSQGVNVTIRGTWLADLDNGVEINDVPEADFRWNILDATLRNLSPRNGAQISIYS